MFELAHFVFDRLKIPGGPQTFLENGRASMKIRNLIERTDLQLRLARDNAGIRLVSACDELEERRLSRAIRPDQSDFFCWIDLESDVSKHVLRSERCRDATKLYEHADLYLRGFLCS